MSIAHKKRMALGLGSLATVGMAATLVAGATLGLFSATSPSQSDQFTAGTVSLTQPADVACTIVNVVPGDTSGSNHQCTFSVTYNGTASAYLGLDLSVNGVAAATVPAAYGSANALTPSALYDGTSNGIGLAVSDGTTSFMSGQTVNGATLANAGTVNSLLIGKVTGSTGDTTQTVNGSGSSVTKTFTVDYTMPAGSSNAYQGSSATITLRVHAVQAAHQAAGASSCTLGLTCAAMQWS